MSLLSQEQDIIGFNTAHTNQEQDKSSQRTVEELAVCVAHVTYMSSNWEMELFSPAREIYI